MARGWPHDGEMSNDVTLVLWQLALSVLLSHSLQSKLRRAVTHRNRIVALIHSLQTAIDAIEIFIKHETFRNHSFPSAPELRKVIPQNDGRSGEYGIDGIPSRDNDPSRSFTLRPRLTSSTFNSIETIRC